MITEIFVLLGTKWWYFFFKLCQDYIRTYGIREVFVDLLRHPLNIKPL